MNYELIFFGMVFPKIILIGYGMVKGKRVLRIIATKTMQRNLNTHHGNENEVLDEVFDEMLHDTEENLTEGPPDYESLLTDAETPLYPGCSKYTQLTGVLELFELKAEAGWTDYHYSKLMVKLKDMFPEGNTLPSSTYETKKMLCPMGLDAEKIHACPNDCVLYRKDYNDLHECPTCGTSRYKVKSNGENTNEPAKVMWYLPVVPRLKRLFANAKDAENLTWHADGRNKDGMLRHAADSPQWKHIDTNFPNFSRETRNLRLRLCTDGINPFGNMSSQHSTWPVLLVNYNLPPWLCMKRKYIMLSILISGPKQPGNDIDVYLAPLIEDLKKLWDEGERVYDEYRKETFTLRVMIFCTINDFPAYGNLSGHVVKGYKACPICEDDTKAVQLKSSKKVVYPFQRVFLPRNHPYRRLRKAFNGEPEHRSPPKPLTGKQVYERVKDINCVFGKPYKSLGDKLCYKKRSAFWILPYWEHLSVRHCIDVMHVEKNVFDSLIGTLLNMPGKTKDGEKARNDMVKMGIRLELKPTKKGKRYYLPPVCYTLSKKEKKVLCESLHNVKVPSGYSSNIRNLMSLKDLKLVGLKSHDCHTLMQEILPIAIRLILPKQVRQAIIRLCLFFKAICSRVLDHGKLDSLQSQLIVTLCQLEMYFPPSLFDIMVHLVVHLVREVKLCGPVYLRYMYPFERNMGDLKGYVRNRSRPEGRIVEGYLTDEVLRYCIEHLEKLETLGLPKPRHNKREYKVLVQLVIKC
ncbi:uncharacterized protein [Spinacia oleracea]|uniref:DUF4218 domain-containing protein n=1 Tax=Spinacia oleracea TaxID=3562 RepID=A0ABM3RJ49_SPIOL|nr:uncharacterized protein LOC130470083 [Spinacia oleracea]